jgi:hypothetical protein
VFKVVKSSLGGTLVPLIAALVLIGLGIALAHAGQTADGRLAFGPGWMMAPMHAPIGLGQLF